jgi:hypothetical protein
MSKRINEFISVKEALQEMLQQNKLQTGIDKVHVKDAWETVMGKGVSSYTEAVELKRDVLIVKLSSSTLREELSYGKEKIILMMNENIGKRLIKKVKLL